MIVQQKLDTIAIFLSGLCAIHCLLMPFIIVLFPFCTASCCEQDGFHQMMVYFVLPFSGIPLFLGCKRNFKTPIVFTGLIGLAIIIFAAFWGHATVGALGEKIMTTSGGVMLALAHIANYRLCKCKPEKPVAS